MRCRYDEQVSTSTLPAIPSAWAGAVTAPVAQALEQIDLRMAGGDVLPQTPTIFRALELTAPEQVKVVIVGQDPYPTPGHADGLAFSVADGVTLPRSLVNIMRERHDDLGLPVPASGNLQAWAREGVLLLNRSLTVAPGQIDAHKRWGWETVTRAVLAHVAAGPPCVFVLWGRPAQNAAATLDLRAHPTIATAHPSPLSARRGFFGSRPFSTANRHLAELGRDPVDWRLDAER